MPNPDWDRQPRKGGKFSAKDNVIEKGKVLREQVQKEMGYHIKDKKDTHEYTDEMIYQLEKAKLINSSTKINKYGFTEDFFTFLGLNKTAQNYYNLTPQLSGKALEGDAAAYFTPVDDFYGTPGGGDAVYDYGRIPVNHLMILASQRLGIVYRVCNGTAGDVIRNRFSFVDYDNNEKVIERSEVMKWMRHSRFWDHLGYILDYDGRCGLGHLIGYYPGQKDYTEMHKAAPKTRPNAFESFSAYAMTPVNLLESMKMLDYNKQEWKFRGGYVRNALIHESRVYVLETRRVEGGLRGLAYAEIAWTPLMCYLNTMYYILKGLSRLGTVMASINSDKEYPTVSEVTKYIELWDLMRANNLFVLGKNATFNLQNTANVIGQGIENYLEFLREDISAAWVFPKNQLFGRSEGGGLEGAGAIVSKEDYLSSNISVKQLNITNDVMDILNDMCHFPELDNATLRWNIDLHKTEEQRLKEESMREQLEQIKINTKMQKLQLKLFRKQSALQAEMSDVQMKMMKENPEQFMETSEKDEENLEEKPAPTKGEKDFINYLQIKMDNLQREYISNNKILRYIGKMKRA